MIGIDQSERGLCKVDWGLLLLKLKPGQIREETGKRKETYQLRYSVLEPGNTGLALANQNAARAGCDKPSMGVVVLTLGRDG